MRRLLTEDEYARSTAKTEGASDQFVSQPKDVPEKVAQIKKHGPTKQMLQERAADLGVEGRSSKSKDDLLKTIEGATDKSGRGQGSRSSLSEETKGELQDLARKRGVEGRPRCRLGRRSDRRRRRVRR